MIEVSLVIPVFNTGNKIKKCLKSVINQTFNELEIIIVNDGSTDNSLDICQNYSQRDNRIRIITQKNQGSMCARQKGIHEAIGQYIIFIDSDDWIEVDMVKKLYQEAIKTNSDIVVCKKQKTAHLIPFIKKDVNASFDFFYNKYHTYENSMIKNVLAKSFFSSGCFPCELFAKIYNRDLLIDAGRYTSNIKFFSEDLFFNFEVFLNSNKVTLLDNVLYFYRNGGATSKYMQYYFNDIVRGLEEKLRILAEFYDKSDKNLKSAMYCNFFELYKSCIFNMSYSDMSENDFKIEVMRQLNLQTIKDGISYISRINYDHIFIKALMNKDVDYLYNISRKNRRNRWLKDKLLNILSI